MTEPPLEPLSGEPPPVSVTTDAGAAIDLSSLAQEISRRYLAEFPDDEARYRDRSKEWCVHDNQYLLYWGAEAVDGYVDMLGQVAWLASVLEARDYPLDRLARDLEIGADVVRDQLSSAVAEPLADVLIDAAGYVRSHGTFLV